MKTFVFTHAGIWPVGACSAVRARSVEEAECLLYDKLESMGINKHAGTPADHFYIKEVPLEREGVTVILSGEY